MKREIITTRDGSHTISVPELAVTYHSVHGALQESLHVFIEAGLNYYTHRYPGSPVHIFEMGLGTGLNAVLTVAEAYKKNKEVYYECTELYPLEEKDIVLLNYCDIEVLKKYKEDFMRLHNCPWETETRINDHFSILKRKESLLSFSTDKHFNLIYYDAFAPAAQPELWTLAVFQKLFQLLSPGGLLVTYCSKGDVRRAMQDAGFMVEKIPGPPGKREMIRAEKN